MMIRKPFGINQFRSHLHQTLLEALRLGNPAKGRHPPPQQDFEAGSLACEYVLQVQRMMNAFDDAGGSDNRKATNR